MRVSRLAAWGGSHTPIHRFIVLCAGLVAFLSTPAAGAAAPARAYELVSPGAANVGDVTRVPGIADNGSVAAYLSVQALDGAASSGLGAYAIARRTADGWVSSDANPPLTPAAATLVNANVLRFSPDFDAALFATPLRLAPEDVDSNGDIYRVAIPNGDATFLSDAGDAGNALNTDAALIGASADLDRVVFIANDLLGYPGQQFFTRDASGIRLASVLPGDGAAALAVSLGDQSSRYIADTFGNRGVSAPYGGRHITSDDATRVFFNDTNADAPEGALYLRDDDRTVVVSASRSGDVGTPHQATFIAASHDGSVAYFDSPAQLTDDAAPGGGIYRYELDGDLTLLTPDPGDPAGLQVAAGSAIMSDDASHIYFTTVAQLTPGATPGVPHLYRWSDEGVKFIANVDAGDVVPRASRDGRYVVLASAASLAGAATNGFRQLYLYDDATGDLACASCRPGGSASQGAANLDAQPIFVSDSLSSPRNITDDGRLFFASADRLVPKDVGAGADIYLFDHGSLSLITSGTADTDAYMGDNTPDGRDVFFMTRERLLRSDLDGDELDLYDARVGGGFPEPAPPSPPCREEDCLGPASGPPALPAPSSTSAQGNGNVPPPPVTPSKTRSVRLLKLTRAQRARLARSGRARIAVRITGGGTVTVRAAGALAGRRTTLGTGRRTVHADGSLVAHVTLRLGTAARRSLAGGSRLRITLEARLSGVARRSSTTLTLARR